jgi:hypothetical protein
MLPLRRRYPLRDLEGLTWRLIKLISIDLVDPVAPVDVPRDIAVGRKRPTWARQTLQEAEGYATPHGTFQEKETLEIFMLCRKYEPHHLF